MGSHGFRNTAAGAMDVLGVLVFIGFTASMTSLFLLTESTFGHVVGGLGALAGATVTYVGLRNLARRLTESS